MAPVGPLAWELPYAASAAIKKKKKERKKEKEKEKRQEKNQQTGANGQSINNSICYHLLSICYIPGTEYFKYIKSLEIHKFK